MSVCNLRDTSVLHDAYALVATIALSWFGELNQTQTIHYADIIMVHNLHTMGNFLDATAP